EARLNLIQLPVFGIDESGDRFRGETGLRALDAPRQRFEPFLRFRIEPNQKSVCHKVPAAVATGYRKFRFPVATAIAAAAEVMYERVLLPRWLCVFFDCIVERTTKCVDECPLPGGRRRCRPDGTSRTSRDDSPCTGPPRRCGPAARRRLPA